MIGWKTTLAAALLGAAFAASAPAVAGDGRITNPDGYDSSDGRITNPDGRTSRRDRRHGDDWWYRRHRRDYGGDYGYGYGRPRWVERERYRQRYRDPDWY